MKVVVFIFFSFSRLHLATNQPDIWRVSGRNQEAATNHCHSLLDSTPPTGADAPPAHVNLSNLSNVSKVTWRSSVGAILISSCDRLLRVTDRRREKKNEHQTRVKTKTRFVKAQVS